jgi:hypothetical protein
MERKITIHLEQSENANSDEAAIAVFELLLKAAYDDCGQPDLTSSQVGSDDDNTE